MVRIRIGSVGGSNRTPGSGPISGRDPAANRVGRVLFGLIFFGIFTAVGATVSYVLLFGPLMKIQDARGWPAVPCVILASDVGSHSGSKGGTTYSIDIRYSYEYLNQRYESDRYQFVSGSSSGYNGKAAVVAQYPVGSTQSCYVNPAHPSEAVLNRGFTPMMWFGLIPLIFLVVGVVGLFYTIKPRPAGETRALTGATAGVQFALAKRFGRKIDAYDWLPPVQLERPVIVEEKASTSLVGAGIVFAFSAVWITVLSFTLFKEVVQSWAKGSPDICPTLFSLPFAAVGVGGVGMAGYLVLRSFNPRPRVTLSASVVPVGGSFDLQWELIGNASRVQSLEITLVGREAATYRRGTDTRTDRHTLLELPIAQMEPGPGRDPQFSGRATVQVPPDVMHSFDAPNNKITWEIRVRGRIPRWPDITSDFTVVLVPPEALPKLMQEAQA
jgi:hypothetical protein